MTQEDLAYLSKVNQTAISKIENGRTRSPQPRTLGALADALGVPVERLTGEAPAARETPADYISRALQSAVERILPAQFPIFDQEAGAGPGVEVADYGFTEPGMEWRDLFGVRVRGGSMEPEVRDGDLLVVARDKSPDVGDIVLATIDGGMVAKRLARRGSRMVLAGDAEGEFPFDAAKVEGTVVEIRRRPR